MVFGGILIFVMAVLGAFAFTSTLQGYFLIKNRWYEIPFFLAASIILFNPGILSSLLGVKPEYKYFFYILGTVILVGITVEQKIRKKRLKPSLV